MRYSWNIMKDHNKHLIIDRAEYRYRVIEGHIISRKIATDKLRTEAIIPQRAVDFG